MKDGSHDTFILIPRANGSKVCRLEPKRVKMQVSFQLRYLDLCLQEHGDQICPFSFGVRELSSLDEF